MRHNIVKGGMVVAAVWLATLSLRAADDAFDAAMRAYWDAHNQEEAEKLVTRIATTAADFDTVLARLRAGRPYTKQPTGQRSFRYSNKGSAFNFDNLVYVPPNYDPARKWTLRVQLHGGIGRDEPATGDEERMLTRIPTENQIQIHPRGWADAAWWNANQVENIFHVLDEVKRTYNADESRIYVTGISDGGTGVYYLAMRAATPWSACMPLNGNIAVLANPEVGAEGEMFLGNLVNCPFHIVNGGRDRLYPAEHITPYINLMKRAGVPLFWQVYPEAGHDTSWWPVEHSKYDAFLDMHQRETHPDRISWETERIDRYSRMRWLVINLLGPRPSDAKLDVVQLQDPEEAALRSLVATDRRSGRVDIVRKGNAFDAKSRGVREFTVLLSPDVINFARPVTVAVNGKTAFDGLVKKDVATLLKWNARDNDRTMLYGAELKIAVP